MSKLLCRKKTGRKEITSSPAGTVKLCSNLLLKTPLQPAHRGHKRFIVIFIKYLRQVV